MKTIIKSSIFFILIGSIFLNLEAGCNQSKFCPNCGYELKAEWNSCPKCGINLCNSKIDINKITCDSLSELKNDYLKRISKLKILRNSGIGLAVVGPAVVGGTIWYLSSGRRGLYESENITAGGFFGCIMTAASIPMIIVGNNKIKKYDNLIKSINLCVSVSNGPGFYFEFTY
jgi:hypothetical protein